MKQAKTGKKTESVSAVEPTSSTPIKESQLELELAIPKTLRTEFNFLKFPFFDLGWDTKRTKIEINESVETQEGSFKLLWRVSRNIESKFPGDFEKRVHRVVEQIINVAPKPIENPLRIGSIHYIARLMGIVADSGKNYQDIYSAFKNIVKTSIEAEGTFQLKEAKSKSFINDTFHLYDRVIFRGEQLPDGQTADCVYLMLGSWYLQNINNNYVVPLDWKFYNSLQGTITTRMYEFLSIQFFVALERTQSYGDLLYSQVCDYFPLVPQSPAWKAHKQLKKAHDSLTEAKYLDRVEWLENTSVDDWVIRYWIGTKAREEYERNKTEIRQASMGLKPVPTPEQRRRRKLTNGTDNNSSLNESGSLIAHEMTSLWGISASTASSLLKRYSDVRVREVLDWAAWAKKEKPMLIEKNPAGWIRKALQENWQKPTGFETEAERKKRTADREQKQAELTAHMEAQAKEELWKSWYTMTPQQRVQGDLLFWKVAYKREHSGNEPITDLLRQKEAELIATLPSSKEKQNEIFGYVKYPEQA